jgi:hypothetical protein
MYNYVYLKKITKQTTTTMAIVSHIPKKDSIIDYRKEEGGYYIANCEVCAREYYPKKSNSKYCSNNCMISAFRTRSKLGLTVPRVKKDTKTVIVGDVVECGSKTKCSQYFKQYNAKVKSYDAMSSVVIGGFCMFLNHKIRRISQNKYEVLR